MQLFGMLEKVGGANAASYTTRDNTGYTVDTIKVLRAGKGYVGVYHINDNWVFSVRLGFSTDLLQWRYIRTLATDASQPTIYPLPGGGFLVAYEKSEPDGTSHLEFRTYGSLQRLMAGHFDHQFDAPQTLSRVTEGTPSIRSVALRSTIEDSTIQVGFHYFDTSLGVDRNAVGTLTDFSIWTTHVNDQINDAFHPQVGGNIGGRDYVTFDGCPFTVIEAQSLLDVWSSWRVYLYDDTADKLAEVPVQTPLDSISFGDPKVTILTTPRGQRSLVVSYFLFTPGAGAGEAGPLVFYKDL